MRLFRTLREDFFRTKVPVSGMPTNGTEKVNRALAQDRIQRKRYCTGLIAPRQKPGKPNATTFTASSGLANALDSMFFFSFTS